MPGTIDSSPFPPQRQTLKNGVLVPKRPPPVPPEGPFNNTLPYHQPQPTATLQIPTYLPSPSTTPPPLQHRPFTEPGYSTAPDIRPRTASRNVLLENYSYLHPFESDKSAFSRQLKCIKCLHVFDTPLVLPCCGGRMCMSCVKGNKGFDKSGQLCSLCMTAVSMSDLLVDEDLKRTVDDLHVYCIRKRRGCEWVGPRKYLFVHVAEECILAPGMPCCHCRDSLWRHHNNEKIPRPSNSYRFSESGNNELPIRPRRPNPLIIHQRNFPLRFRISRPPRTTARRQHTKTGHRHFRGAMDRRL